MPDFGERLRTERERAGFSQSDMADTCGVTMRSQRNYEKGERSPDAGYLQKAFQAGVDVLFVLTGERSGLAASSALPPDEQLLLDSYRAMSPTKKKQLLAELLIGGAGTKASRKPQGGVNVAGNNNRTAGRDFHE